jgi:hypothetical protein
MGRRGLYETVPSVAFVEAALSWAGSTSNMCGGTSGGNGGGDLLAVKAPIFNKDFTGMISTNHYAC